MTPMFRGGMTLVVALGLVAVAATPASATIPVTPASGDPNAGATAKVDIQTPSQLDACLRAVGQPAQVHVSFSPQCGAGQFSSTMTVIANPKLPPGFQRSFTVQEYPQDDPSQAPFDQGTWTMIVPASTTTSSSSTTTTTVRATTTTGAATTTTVAAPTTAAPVVTTAPPTTVVTDVIAPVRATHRTRALLLAPLVAVLAAGAALVAARRRRSHSGVVPVPSPPAPAAARNRPARSRETATILPAATTAGDVGLVLPSSSTTLPWGRVLPLRAGAANGRRARFRWQVDGVQQGQAGRWAPWPAGRPTGGLRVRRATDAGEHSSGAQALLLHPYLPDVGDTALVKLRVTTEHPGERNGVAATFPVWIRFERTSDWTIAADVVHAPTAPDRDRSETAVPEPGAGSGLGVALRLDVSDGPWATGERLLVTVDWAGERALACTWTANAGSFPIGSNDATVVYEAPGAPGDVVLAVLVSDPATGAAERLELSVPVAMHTVVLVSDIFGDALDGESGPLWPPAGNEPLTALRAAGPELRVTPDSAALRARPLSDHGARTRAVISAAGHTPIDAPYDWRLGPGSAAGLVGATVAEVTVGTGTSANAALTATVIAHGYGGLVVREWLRDPDIAGVIDDALLVGTPHHGLPLAFRWLRFGGRFGPTHTSRLADAGDAVASAAGREVVETWPALYYLLPTPAWFAGAGPILDDRVAGAGVQPDATSTYLSGSGRLTETELVTEVRRWAGREPTIAAGVRAHSVYGVGLPTECLYSHGAQGDIVGALSDPAASSLAGSGDVPPEFRSFSDRDHSLVITLLDGDGVVPTASGRGALQPVMSIREHRVERVQHEELLEDTNVLAYVVYVIEHLAGDGT